MSAAMIPAVDHGPAAEPPAPEAAAERLTLGRLVEERLLRAAADALTAEVAARPIAWCLPWQDALDTTEPLTDVLVYARDDQVDLVSLTALSRRNAVAVVVAGAATSDCSGPLPRLAVAPHVTYRDVNHLVAELELARETHVMRYGITVHRSLVELLYRGAGLAALCHQMTRLSNCTTAFLDPQFRVLAFEQSRDRIFEPVAVANAIRAIGPTTPERDEVTARPRVCPLDIGGVRATAVVNAILLAGRHDGWVVIVEPTDQPHSHDLAQHRVVVEQGATIVGTELLRMRSVEQAEERARGDFVHALLHGRFTTQHDLDARASHYDFPIDATYGVVVAGHLSETDGSESLTALFQLARDATRLSPGPESRTLASVVGNVLAVIRQVAPARRAGGVEAAKQALASYASVLEHELERRTRHPVAVAFGRPVVGAEQIFTAYREARIALGLHQRLGLKQACGFQDLRVFALLAELGETPAAAAFTRDVLAPLRSVRGGGADLEHAVTTYIESGGNLNAAARTLHIHRNTMLYKLERASRLLELDLREAEHQFTVWLAHKMDLLADTTAMVDRDLRP
jgi:sugar diacid utilization regulator